MDRYARLNSAGTKVLCDYNPSHVIGSIYISESNSHQRVTVEMNGVIQEIPEGQSVRELQVPRAMEVHDGVLAGRNHALDRIARGQSVKGQKGTPGQKRGLTLPLPTRCMYCKEQRIQILDAERLNVLPAPATIDIEARHLPV